MQTLRDEYTLVLCLKDYTEQAHLIKAMHEMYESWRRQIPGSSFFIGVSDCIRNILELRVCYEKSVAALFSRPVQSKDAIVLVQTDSAAKGIPYLPDDLEAQLRSLLEKPTDEPLLAYVDGILDRNYRCLLYTSLGDQTGSNCIPSFQPRRHGLRRIAQTV